MAVAESTLRAIKKYHKKFDSIKVYVPKGTREMYKQAATVAGLSLNNLCIKAINEYIVRNQLSAGTMDTEEQRV